MRLIRCSHADAAESVYGAGGGGVRRRRGRRMVKGAELDKTLCRSWHQRSKVKRRLQRSVVQAGGGGGASGVLIPGTTEERRRKMLSWSQNHRVGSAGIQTQRSKQTAALGSKIQLIRVVHRKIRWWFYVKHCWTPGSDRCHVLVFMLYGSGALCREQQHLSDLMINQQIVTTAADAAVRSSGHIHVHIRKQCFKCLCPPCVCVYEWLCCCLTWPGHNLSESFPG